MVSRYCFAFVDTTTLKGGIDVQHHLLLTVSTHIPAGLLKRDPFITAPNAPGVVMAVFCIISCIGLADEQVRRRRRRQQSLADSPVCSVTRQLSQLLLPGSLPMYLSITAPSLRCHHLAAQARTRVRNILCLEALILPVMGVVTVFACEPGSAEQLLIWGMGGNAISMVYYGAPLSTMAQVIRTRNSASILLPLTLMNLTNAVLWTTYGLAVQDLYVWVPNGIGAVLSLAQLALAMMFPARPGSAGASSGMALDRSHIA